MTSEVLRGNGTNDDSTLTKVVVKGAQAFGRAAASEHQRTSAVRMAAGRFAASRSPANAMGVTTTPAATAPAPVVPVGHGSDPLLPTPVGHEPVPRSRRPSKWLHPERTSTVARATAAPAAGSVQEAMPAAIRRSQCPGERIECERRANCSNSTGLPRGRCAELQEGEDRSHIDSL